MHWQQHNWSTLSQIDVNAISSAEHRAKLALCAAVGLAQQQQATDAMQALERALDWGIAPEITAYLASRGVLSALQRPLATRLNPDPLRQATRLRRSMASGAWPDNANSDWWLRESSPTPTSAKASTAKPKTPEDYRDSPRFSAEAYAEYAALSQQTGAAHFQLIDTKSLPRSGLHYLKQTLERLLPGHFSFCEWYQEPGCCKRMPCALTAYAEAAQQPPQAKLRLLKSHDFDLDDPAYPLTPHIRRLILIRDPLFVLTSWFELEQMQQHYQVLEAHGISMKKVNLLHEPEVTRQALRLIDAAYRPIDRQALRQWLQQCQAYISGFLRRWAVPALEHSELGWRLLRYEDINAYLSELLSPLQAHLSADAQANVERFLRDSAGRFKPRSDPLTLKSIRISEDVRRYAGLFEETARALTDNSDYQIIQNVITQGRSRTP
ncbi:hypothetical protein ThidrDRAFT_3697 [Thiorhodococcus drewsii AZ1]|uniref:Sulfotransferase n=2 Tax=Thiorhodococcus drewsii TaxID=210408 RepID=G2E5Y4_9GAMM|nr:hypothetical protein ThidrDRAFT_3697 [Thiorhodococcus drewsii AZ1]